MTHAWCSDPSRDAAVRAAEDERTAPLPTLEECIERQKQTARPCGGTDPAPSRGERGAADTGMRTERITLEVTHNAALSAREWRMWRTIFDPRYGESVRVVSDEEREAALPDVSDQDGDRVAIDWQGLTKVLQAERDAANRERDAAVAESERRLRLCETMKRDGDSARFHAAVAQARVAELEEARKRFDTALEEARDASGINDFIVQRDEAFDERDAAIRERDELRKSWLRSEESGTRLLAQRNAALDAADGLRKRVAELEAASGGGEKKPMRMPSREWFARMVDVDEANISVGGLASRVAEVEAASGGEQEPDAWGIVRDGNVDSVTHRLFRNEAGDIAEKLGGTVVPLYRSPPQPRGWLTNEEREAVEASREFWQVECDSTLGDDTDRRYLAALSNLLARSTPPEVRLVRHLNYFDCHGDRVDAFDAADVLAALVAAGVEVAQ
jgi:hypothetical protein